MSFLVPLTLFAWPPLVAVLFLARTPRQAILVAYIGALLFLPMAGLHYPGLGIYDKTAAAGLGALIGLVIFDLNTITRLRPAWLDLLPIIWTICPLLSCLANGLTFYDATAAVYRQFVLFGLPYLFGRLYFSDLRGLRQLALGIIMGALIYVPLCLYEVRMSPQLHTMVYGFYPHQFAQARRYGGWRPSVFMEHGLAVATWMAVGSVLAIWLWRRRALPEILAMPHLIWIVALVATSFLCKSFGPFALLVAGIAALLLSSFRCSRILILCLLSTAPVYMVTRISGAWSGEQLTGVLAALGAEDRADSLQIRISNENRVLQRNWEQPLLGSGWGTYTYDERGTQDVVTDGFWIWTIGRYGLLGLISMTASILAPAAGFCLRFPIRFWRLRSVAPAAALSVILGLHMIDNLFNGMTNPVFILAAGGLAGLAARTRLRRTAKRARAASRSATRRRRINGGSPSRTPPPSRLPRPC